MFAKSLTLLPYPLHLSFTKFLFILFFSVIVVSHFLLSMAGLLLWYIVSWRVKLRRMLRNGNILLFLSRFEKGFFPTRAFNYSLNIIQICDQTSTFVNSKNLYTYQTSFWKEHSKDFWMTKCFNKAMVTGMILINLQNAFLTIINYPWLTFSKNIRYWFFKACCQLV